MRRAIRILPNLTNERVAAFHSMVRGAGEDECWLWTGAVDGHGYGSFRLRRYSTVGAHRVAWCIANNADPLNRHVLHRCDNPPCVNPNHLWLGDALLNALDKVAKGRARGRFSDYRGSLEPRHPVPKKAPEENLPWFLRGLPRK